jgi:hypothetical protein
MICGEKGIGFCASCSESIYGIDETQGGVAATESDFAAESAKNTKKNSGQSASFLDDLQRKGQKFLCILPRIYLYERTERVLFGVRQAMPALSLRRPCRRCVGDGVDRSMRGGQGFKGKVRCGTGVEQFPVGLVSVEKCRRCPAKVRRHGRLCQSAGMACALQGRVLRGVGLIGNGECPIVFRDSLACGLVFS